MWEDPTSSSAIYLGCISPVTKVHIPLLLELSAAVSKFQVPALWPTTAGYFSLAVSLEKGSSKEIRQSLKTTPLPKKQNNQKTGWDRQNFLYLKQFAFIRLRRSDVAFGELINLFSEVSILLSDTIQLSLSFRGGTARFEAQFGRKSLFGTFRCHGLDKAQNMTAISAHCQE